MNDNDAYTFPGAGYSEAGFDVADYTTYECVTDADGDGYAAAELVGCYTLELEDSYGDGWNGNELEVYEDGSLIGAATISSGSSNTEEVCVANGSVVEMVFVAGSYTSEISGTVYGTDGSTLGTFTGTSGSSWTGTSSSLDFSDGISYVDGETFYTETTSGSELVGGSDPDDGDATTP